MIKAARVVAACLTLAACSHQPMPAEPTLIATVVTETMVAEVNESVTPAMLVGHWGERGDCTKDISISADGAFRSYTGGAGTWTLDGNMLTMATNAGSSRVWVGTIGADQLVFAHQNRSAETWQRCA